jgi:DNA polymerase V
MLLFYTASSAEIVPGRRFFAMYSRDLITDGAAVGASPGAGPVARKNPVSAGFGSPGEDATVKRIDLNDALIRHPQATFVMRAAGSTMHAAGIDDGDVLLVDRAIQAASGSIVIAVFEGELICRRLWQQPGATKLQAASPEHDDIVIGEGVPLEVWGVVTTVIKSLLV